MVDKNSLLGFALLGLIQQQPMSGYDLRKIFASTALGSFSDSPGAIYPALRRLEARGLACGAVEDSLSLRKRRIYRMTPQGLAAFEAWLKKPVTRDDVIRHVDDLMLRFSFMDQTLGAEQTVRFLRELAEEIFGYLPSLKQYLEAHANEMPLSGRLALECGIQGYEAQLRWARTSIALYEQREGNQV
jgi:DNA-binding PadR family transcriptional regulator